MSSSFMSSQEHQYRFQQQKTHQQNGKGISFRDESTDRARYSCDSETNMHYDNQYNYHNDRSNENDNSVDENPFATSSHENSSNPFETSLSTRDNDTIDSNSNFYRQNQYPSAMQNQIHLNYSNNQNIHNQSSNNYSNNNYNDNNSSNNNYNDNNYNNNNSSNNDDRLVQATLIMDDRNVSVMCQTVQSDVNNFVGDRKKEAQKLWRHKGTGASQMIEERRLELFKASAHSSKSFSVKLIDAQTRFDINDQSYTVYILQVSSQQTISQSQITNHNDTNGTNCLVEHRYSDFNKLHSTLEANGIKFKNSKFPRKNLAGRIGNWTPSLTWAPEKHADMIQRRLYKLDAWLVELCELLQQNQIPHPHLQKQIIEFLVPSYTNHHQQQQDGRPQMILPCDKENNVAWKPLLPTQQPSLQTPSPSTLLLSNQPYNDNENNNDNEPALKHKRGVSKWVSNPIRFTLGSSIRQATYAVMSMCGSNRDSGLKKYMPTSDVTIPLDLLQKARGLAFLTVAKGGFVISTRFGTGLIIAKRNYPTGPNNPSNNYNMTGVSWSPPCAIGTFGMGWGALIGGDITTYLIVLNTDKAVEAFAQPSGTINLGAELDIAVGPVGRGATGNLNAGTKAKKIVPAYAYAHSKGFFAGISLESSMIATRPEVNAKFYGKHVSAHEILFGSSVDPPRSAQCLYKALDEAMSVPTLGLGGLLPSQYLLNNNTNPAMFTNTSNFNNNTLTPS